MRSKRAQCSQAQCNQAKCNQASLPPIICPRSSTMKVRHNLIVAVLGRLAGENPPELQWGSLGEPGQCAIKAPGYPIVLGDLNVAQCHAFAEATRSLDYPAVVGADETPRWFVERARELGVTFLEPIPQQIQVLRDKPVYPGVPGHARQLAAA